jgi:hypothetical protein
MNGLGFCLGIIRFIPFVLLTFLFHRDIIPRGQSSALADADDKEK